MPRWLFSSLMIAMGIVALHQALVNPCITLRGSKRPLKKWQGRIFLGIYSAWVIVVGLLVYFTP